jgi:hypothetical protein
VKSGAEKSLKKSCDFGGKRLRLANRAAIVVIFFIFIYLCGLKNEELLKNLGKTGARFFW